MTCFIDSLKSQIKKDLDRKSRNTRVHSCFLHYVWVREQESSDLPHYHVALFLNAHAYQCLGCYNAPISQQPAINMSQRIQYAWASALGMERSQVQGLVHFPESPVYEVQYGDLEAYDQVLKRLLYFAKANTKVYQDGSRWFGCSRINTPLNDPSPNLSQIKKEGQIASHRLAGCDCDSGDFSSPLASARWYTTDPLQ